MKKPLYLHRFIIHFKNYLICVCMASCWNGRQSGLKIQWDLFPWRFESARGYQIEIFKLIL